MKYIKKVTQEVLDTDALNQAINRAKIWPGGQMEYITFGGYPSITTRNQLRLTMSSATIHALVEAAEGSQVVHTFSHKGSNCAETYMGLPVDRNDSLSFGDIRITTELNT